MKIFMKSIYTVLIIFAVSAVTFGQQVNQKDSNGKKNGLWQVKYENDTLKSEGYYKAGKPIGLWKYFYETGQLMAFMEYLTDGVTSNFKLFDESGPRIAEGIYVNGKKDGPWYYYGIDSSKVCDEVYKNGMKNGEEKVYYPKTGKLFQSTNFSNGKKYGWWKQFYNDGIVKTDGTYKNDTLQGKVVYNYPNGKKNLEGNYVNGLREGEFFVYDEKGKLTETLHYKKGILDEKDLKRHMEGENKTTYPEDIIYQGGYEMYNPGSNGGGN
jgi:antitoxin component YwqK of YwqJK toxin-antitoxin module